MILLMIVLLFLFELALASGDGEAGYKALKFGQSANSYIRFSPDMSPFENELSVCSWVRKLRTGSHPIWFHYYSQEIWIEDAGHYNYMLGGSSNLDLSGKFTVPRGHWFHQCNTWSLRTRTLSVYLNGALVGSTTTASGRTLTLGQSLLIGNHNPGHSYYFGGELYQLNVYSEELSSSDVQALAGGGPCSGGEELHEDTRLLKWEDIMQQTRTGSVSEIEIDEWGCKLVKDLKEQLNHTESRLNATVSVVSELTQTRKEMVQELNSTAHELDETQQQLNSTAYQLEDTQQQLNSTAYQLEDTQQQLNSTAHELDEATKRLENVTPWDLLYSEPFFNTVFTKDLFMKLSSSWDIFEDFVARVKITRGLMNHYKAYYKAYPDDEVRTDLLEGDL